MGRIEIFDWCVSCNLFDKMGGCAKCGASVCGHCRPYHEEVCGGDDQD